MAHQLCLIFALPLPTVMYVGLMYLQEQMKAAVTFVTSAMQYLGECLSTTKWRYLTFAAPALRPAYVNQGASVDCALFAMR